MDSRIIGQVSPSASGNEQMLENSTWKPCDDTKTLTWIPKYHHSNGIKRLLDTLYMHGLVEGIRQSCYITAIISDTLLRDFSPSDRLNVT